MTGGSQVSTSCGHLFVAISKGFEATLIQIIKYYIYDESQLCWAELPRLLTEVKYIYIYRGSSVLCTTDSASALGWHTVRAHHIFLY